MSNCHRVTHLDRSIDDFFSIPLDDMEKIVETAVGSDTEVLDWKWIHTLKKGFEGHRAEKRIPTAVYVDDSGNPKQMTFFIKRHINFEQNEAIHHHLLSMTDAPIPRLFGFYTAENQRDITVSEYLEPLFIDEPYDLFLNDEVTFSEFIRATAEFTTVEISETYMKHLDSGYMENHFRARNTFVDSLSRGETFKLASNDRRIPLSEPARSKIQNQLKALCDKMDEMPKGLYHWDHRPCNAGWSRRQNRLVIFDLEDTLLAPRFLDIARWLGAPDEIEQRYADLRSLSNYFLGIYNPRMQTDVSTDEFLCETNILWKLWQLDYIYWYLQDLENIPDDVTLDKREEITRTTTGCMLNSIEILLH